MKKGFILEIYVLKINTIFSSFVNEENKLYVKIWYLVPIGIIIYQILYFARAFTIYKIKWFIQNRNIHNNYLLLIYGFFGSLITAGLCLLTTFVSCNVISSDNIIKDICFFKKENEDKFYYDIFSLYFNGFDWIKLILIIFEVIFFFFINYLVYIL